MTDMTYMTYMTYITDSTYMTYRTYMTYITDITDTLHFLRFQSMTRHDMTLLHILTYGSCAHGKGKRTEEKKSRVVHLSHLHAGLSLACSVASLSHPSVAPCQIIMTYSMIALQTAS